MFFLSKDLCRSNPIDKIDIYGWIYSDYQSAIKSGTHQKYLKFSSGKVFNCSLVTTGKTSNMLCAANSFPSDTVVQPFRLEIIAKQSTQKLFVLYLCFTLSISLNFEMILHKKTMLSVIHTTDDILMYEFFRSEWHWKMVEGQHYCIHSIFASIVLS